MKTLRNLAAAALALLLAAGPAVAQWQTPNHSIPIGRGGGTTGFNSVAPGTAGVPLVSTGLGLDPTFSPATNAGIRPGAANTVKGSLNGASTVDTGVPACTGLGQSLRWTAGVGFSCGTVVSVTGFDMPINLGLSSSAGANALTFTVTQADGSVPTAGNPVVVPFRSTTATNGAVVLGTISSTLTLTIPSTATLGTANSTPFRVWIFVNYNAGTPTLAVATCSNATLTTLYPCAAWETSLKTTVAMSAGALTSGVLYSPGIVSNDAVRIVGYCDYASGLATAGTWASNCTTLQVMGPGVKKPGDVVQTIYATTTANGSTASATFAALGSGLTQSITTTSSPNFVRASSIGTISINAQGTVGLQFARGASLIGVPLSYSMPVVGGANSPAALFVLDAPGTLGTAGATYGFQGKTTAGTMSYPIVGTGVNLQVEEIMG